MRALRERAKGSVFDRWATLELVGSRRGGVVELQPALSRAVKSRSPLVPLHDGCLGHRYRDQGHRRQPLPPHAWGWRELVDEDQAGQDQDPAQVRHADDDHRSHQPGAAPDAAEAVSRANDQRAAHQAEREGSVQRAQLPAPRLTRDFDGSQSVQAGQRESHSADRTLIGPRYRERVEHEVAGEAEPEPDRQVGGREHSRRRPPAPSPPSERRANSYTRGSAEGSIIAAIITAQLAARDSSDPRPIAIPPVDLDCQIINAHATAARARKASAVRAGGEISLLARPG